MAEVSTRKDWKATVVFFSIDALGHINPILSIVKELRHRKLRAIILTTRRMKEAEALENQGFELEHCVEANEDKGDTELIVKNLMNIFRQGPEFSSKATYGVDGAVGGYLDDVIAKHSLIEAKLKSLKPSLIVVDHVVGVPCTTTVAKRWARLYSGFPSNLMSLYNENFVAIFGLKLEEMTPEKRKLAVEIKKPVLDKCRRFFDQLGLKDPKLWASDIDLAPVSPFLNFYLGPNELGFENEPTLKRLPESWLKLEHTIEPSRKTFSLPPNLMELPGKLIYLSLGTLVSSDAEMINRLLVMLSKSPNKIVVSMGAMHEQIKLFPNMWGRRFVDQQGILPQIDLFITHGGHNSIIESFYYGVPGLIVMPVFADQFDAARRIEDCGFGVKLNPFDCKEEELLGSIDCLLANNELKSRMRAISERMSKIKYHVIAADQLERLIY